MADRSYHEQQTIDNNVKLRDLVRNLPSFCKDFFRGIEPTTESRTRIAYAYDLAVFFHFVQETNPMYKNVSIQDIPLELLDQMKPIDLEEYVSYLSYYVRDGKEFINDENGRKRKLIALRSFYNYYYQKQMIETNPAAFVKVPKTHQKEIIRLEVDEVARLLDEVESGQSMTKSQLKYHNKTKVRDLAIMTLLLGTGIRVSECVGLDIRDVDFKNNGIKIVRKGGNEVIIYFGEEVEDALKAYMNERNQILAVDGHTSALFLSMQRKRISVKSVENLVKKYSSMVTTMKKITPHKLRSTYGTTLYQETGDIYLVADVLGHKDVNTTKKHYAAIEESRRRSAAKVVRLREKEF